MVGSAFNDYLYADGLQSAGGGVRQDYISGSGSLYGEAGNDTPSAGRGHAALCGSGFDSLRVVV